MTNIQNISATKARNNFFNLINNSYLKKQTYLVKKGNIPMVYVVPADSQEAQKQDQLALLDKIKKFHKTMPVTPDSVPMIREMRLHGK